MPRYFLHLRRGEEAFLDAEGSEFPDLEALRRAALHDARDTMSWDIKEGRLDLYGPDGRSTAAGDRQINDAV